MNNLTFQKNVFVNKDDTLPKITARIAENKAKLIDEQMFKILPRWEVVVRTLILKWPEIIQRPIRKLFGVRLECQHFSNNIEKYIVRRRNKIIGGFVIETKVITEAEA